MLEWPAGFSSAIRVCSPSASLLMPTAKQSVYGKADTSRHQGPDERDPRWQGLGPCGREHKPEPKWCSNAWAMWSNCEKCALCLEKVPFKSAPASSWSNGPTAATVAAALKELEEDKKWNACTASMFRGYLKAEQAKHQKKGQRKKAKEPDVDFDPKSQAPKQDPESEEGEKDSQDLGSDFVHVDGDSVSGAAPSQKQPTSRLLPTAAHAARNRQQTPDESASPHSDEENPREPWVQAEHQVTRQKRRQTRRRHAEGR